MELPRTTPSRPRTRTSSLLSNSSRISLGPVIVLSKTLSTSSLSQLPEAHEARGSFIPLRSATSTLKNIAPHITTALRPATRRRRVTFASDDRRLSAPKFDDDDSEESSPPSPEVPYITRTLSSPVFPVFPTSSSPSIRTSSNATSDLHPILASLERKSRICTRVAHCSTCHKPGTDFPRCAKCGDMWCSRSCRLVDGKRHICSTTKIQ